MVAPRENKLFIDNVLEVENPTRGYNNPDFRQLLATELFSKSPSNSEGHSVY